MRITLIRDGIPYELDIPLEIDEGCSEETKRSIIDSYISNYLRTEEDLWAHIEKSSKMEMQTKAR